jgi:alkylation response protein AidB-like acyl-CoA dehydrogenase
MSNASSRKPRELRGIHHEFAGEFMRPSFGGQNVPVTEDLLRAAGGERPEQAGESAGLRNFRLRVRTFFDSVPGLLADGTVSGSVAHDAAHDETAPSSIARAKRWRAGLYDAGLAGFGFPESFGGLGGADDAQAGQRRAEEAIYTEESSGRIPSDESVFGIGIGMALPVIRDHGSDSLRSRFLRPGLRGDEIWCQLYSEPNAGWRRWPRAPCATATSGS